MTEMIQERTGRELFEVHFEALDARLTDQPGWLRELRQAAIARFSESDLPTTRQEEWRHTDISPLKKISFSGESAAIGEAMLTEAVGRHAIETTECWRAVVVNGRFSARLSSLDGLPKGLIIRSLA